jgi:Putative peptidoglycan binding domain
MSDAPSTAAVGAASSAPRRGLGPRRAARWLLALLALLGIGAGAVVALAHPFAAASAPPDALDNGTATALATVARRSLTSQMQVDGTLGYAGSSAIVVPTGTAPSDLQKARQQVASGRVALESAQATRATDAQTLTQARAVLVADERKLAVDCAGTGSAGVGTGSTDSGTGGGASSCATTAQAVTTDRQSVASGEQKVTADGQSIATSRMSLAAAQQSLETAEASAGTYDPGAVFTMLPAAGSVIRRGERLYAIGGAPSLLLYGALPAFRAFRAGMSPGADVVELHANLRALGYGSGLHGSAFSGATARAIGELQAAHGLPRTGELPIGSVIFKASAVRVTNVSAKLGSAVQAGPVLTVSSTRHRVEIALAVSHQSDVKVGDRVVITLPDTSTTTGRVTSVGRVATAGEQAGSTTIAVAVELDHPSSAGQLDQAPVQVSITTASVDGVLVVPVNALLALAGGGYGLELVDGTGAHRLVAVDLGLFDDSDGLVEVTGETVRAGQRIVVPAA